jgi:hypothetical protein
MTATDPHVLIQALEDLDDELSRWSAQARNTTIEARHEYELGRELANQLLHRAAIASYQAGEDRQTVDLAEGELAKLTDRCKEAQAIAESTVLAAETARRSAVDTRDEWDAELRKAQEWLARARRRLEIALQEEARAAATLRDAESNLARAESRLRSCQSDKNRRECNSEVSAVNYAAAQVRQCLAEYELAVAERMAAQEEVAAAEARVACCDLALGTADTAVALAQRAVEAGELGLASAERSLELARAAETWLTEAREHLDEETEAAEEALAQAHLASSAADDAYNELRQADYASDNAQQACSDVRRELDARVDQLRQFNAPTLDDFVGRT